MLVDVISDLDWHPEAKTQASTETDPGGITPSQAGTMHP